MTPGSSRNQGNPIAITLLEEALKLQHSDLPRAVAKAEKALEIARSDRDVQQLSRCLSGLGGLYRLSSRLRESVELLDEALVLQGVDDALRAKIYTQMGAVLNEQSRYSEASEALISAMSLARLTRQTRIEGDAAFNLANTELSQRLLDNARVHFSKALDLYHESGHEIGIANVLGSLGIIALEQKQPERALELYQRAVNILQSHGLERNCGILFKNIAEAHLLLKNHSMALSYCRNVHRIAEKHGVPALDAYAFEVEGLIYTEMKDITTALLHFGEAERLGVHLGMPEIAEFAREKINKLRAMGAA
jgi:tetratricopeptide (TPR) repeat protein